MTTDKVLSRPSQSAEISADGDVKEQRRPQVAKPKPLQRLDSVTNTDGVTFQAGDKILVSAPWSGRAQAEIVMLYADDSGNAWVKYTPKESRSGWPWDGGFVRLERLIKA